MKIKIRINEAGGKMIVRVPERFLEVLPFWIGSIRVVSINGNNLLITVADR